MSGNSYGTPEELFTDLPGELYLCSSVSRRRCVVVPEIPRRILTDACLSLIHEIELANFWANVQFSTVKNIA
jgi:hypothetical protein